MGIENSKQDTQQAGQAGGMEAIVAEYETILLRYAARIVNSPTLAQDVVQNVFIKLFKGWKPGFKPSGRLKGWLYRVTHNEAVDFVRREARLKVLHETHADRKSLECPDGHNCPDALEDRKTLVLENLRKLHPVEQQVILLRMQEGLSYAEISEITGRTDGNIGCIIHNAVRKLAQAVRKQAGGNSNEL